MIKKINTAARVAVLLALSLAVLSGCGGGKEGAAGARKDSAQPAGAPQGAPVQKGGSAPAVIAVTTTRARVGSISKQLDIGGEVVAKDQVGVYADIAGKITSLLIDVGDAVGKGQLIAKVDPSKPGKEYTESPVTAPIFGTITAVPVRVGDTIASTSPVATIGRLDALQIETFVSERFIGDIRPGAEATFSFAAWPGQKLSGRVVKVSPVVDSASRTLKATLELDRADSRVKAGMYATVGLITARRNGVVTIPADCVVERNGKEYKDVVFVVKENRAVQRPVSLGISSGGMVEIAGGIESGDEVVTSGQSLLSDGVQVRVIESRQPGSDA